VRRLFRPHEFVIFFYLLYCCGVAAIRPISPSIRYTAWVLNLTIVAVYACLPMPIVPPWPVTWRTARLVPLVLLLLAYREMGWFALRTPP
jgi:hypothetical protein